MAARIRLTHQHEVRAKIQTSQLINRLHGHAMGEIDLSATQIKAIEVLLKKNLPDLSSVEVTGADGGPIAVANIDVSTLAPEQLRALASIPVQSE